MASVLRDSLLSAAASAATLAAALVSSIVVARLLGPAGSGVVAMAFWLATVASALADRGLPQLLLRYAGPSADDPAGQPGLLRAILSPFLRSLVLVMAASAGLLAVGLHRLAIEPAVAVAALGLIAAYALHALSVAAARSRDRFGQIARTSLWGGLLQLLLVPAGALAAGPAGALAGYIARYLPQVLQLRAYVTREPARIAPRMRVYARHLWASDLIEIALLSRLEFLFIGLWLGDASIGQFAVGLAIASPIEQILLHVSPALLVWFVRARSGTDRTAAADAYARALHCLALVVMPVCLGGAVLLPALVPAAFGGAFLPAVIPAVLLMLSVAPGALVIAPWAMLGAEERSGALLRVQLVVGLASAALLALVVPLAGIVGAAALRLAVNIATFAVLAWMVWRVAGAGVRAARMARILLAAMASAAAAALPVALLCPAPGIAAAVLVGALVYGLAIRAFGLLTREEIGPLRHAVAGRLPVAAAAPADRLLAFLAPR